MKVTVKYFAVCHEELGERGRGDGVARGATLRDILNRLEEEWPEINRVLSGNADVCQLGLCNRGHRTLRGRRSRTDSARDGRFKMFKITREIISPQSVISAVEADNAGAIVHFMGTVRNNTGGRKTLYLEYEAYAPMAEKKMTEIGQEIQEKWGWSASL